MEFSGIDQALRFAFNVSRRIEYSRSDPLHVKSTSSESLSPAELHAQSAMILSRVERLSDIESATVYAAYGFGHQRKVAIDLLAKELYPALSDKLPSVAAVAAVIRNWTVKNPTIRMIAQDFGVSYRSAYGWRNATLKHWRVVLWKVLDKLEDELFGKDGFERKE